MTRPSKAQVLAMLLALSLPMCTMAAVPAGTQLPLKAVDKQAFKGGELKRVKFKVDAPSDPKDTESIGSRLAGCIIEGDAAYNPKSGRLYIKKPVLTCEPDTKMGAAFLGGDIMGQLSDAGLDGIKLTCNSTKECTIGSLTPDAEVSFTVTETMGD